MVQSCRCAEVVQRSCRCRCRIAEVQRCLGADVQRYRVGVAGGAGAGAVAQTCIGVSIEVMKR